MFKKTTTIEVLIVITAVNESTKSNALLDQLISAHCRRDEADFNQLLSISR